MGGRERKEARVSQAAAKQGDKITGTDTHLVIPASGGPPAPVPLPFSGTLDGGLSADVLIEDKAAAIRGSEATNSPSHVPPGGSFQKPPSNKGTVHEGSSTVLIDDKPAARNGDPAMTCNDPADAPAGTVIATGTVLCG